MRRILIFYSHYFPAFKAGGPVQSLRNLVETLRDDFQIYIYCSARDLGDNFILQNIIPDQWNDGGENVKIYYLNNGFYRAAKRAFKDCHPDIVYINGMFLPRYNWLPLWLAKSKRIKVVLAPRGMLQQGALAIKPVKKKVFLFFCRLSKLYDNIFWHATDEQEERDIKMIFGKNATSKIVPNIPKAPYKNITPRHKDAFKLRMVYLSLITEKKNLHLVLKALKEINVPIEFDIYGPIHDKAYWGKCERLIEGQLHKIVYRGSVIPDKVQGLLSEYHVSVLPTKGENFGHAIYESFSVGTPALISKFTPWGDLNAQNAGITVATEDEHDWKDAIQRFINLDHDEFVKLSRGAHTVAINYFNNNNFKSAYANLFGARNNKIS